MVWRSCGDGMNDEDIQRNAPTLREQLLSHAVRYALFGGWRQTDLSYRDIQTIKYQERDRIWLVFVNWSLDLIYSTCLIQDMLFYDPDSFLFSYRIKHLLNKHHGSKFFFFFYKRVICSINVDRLQPSFTFLKRRQVKKTLPALKKKRKKNAKQ